MRRRAGLLSRTVRRAGLAPVITSKALSRLFGLKKKTPACLQLKKPHEKHAALTPASPHGAIYLVRLARAFTKALGGLVHVTSRGFDFPRPRRLAGNGGKTATSSIIVRQRILRGDFS